MQGLDGCKRVGLGDKLAIAMIFNTIKQRYIYRFKKNLFLVLIKSEKNDEKMIKNRHGAHCCHDA
jgi:hypothetical protein